MTTVDAGPTKAESAPATPQAAALAPATVDASVLAAPQKEAPAPQDPTKRDAVAAPKKAAPEKYQFKLPEGGESFDEQVLSTYSEVAKSLDLSQEAAQTLLDKVAPVIGAQMSARMAAVHDEWRAATRADPEIGGAKLTESMGHAHRFLQSFASPELREMLSKPGLGDHPEIVRMVVKAGRALSADKFVAGSGGVGPSNSEEAILSKLYPSHTR